MKNAPAGPGETQFLGATLVPWRRIDPDRFGKSQ
jgi:hypothetical protein